MIWVKRYNYIPNRFKFVDPHKNLVGNITKYDTLAFPGIFPLFLSADIFLLSRRGQDSFQDIKFFCTTDTERFLLFW